MTLIQDLPDVAAKEQEMYRRGYAVGRAEEREACVVRKQEDGYWLILHNEKGDAAINLNHEQRGPIVQAVLEASAIRVQP